MPATVSILDTVEGSSVDSDFIVYRCTRGAIVTGMTGNPATALEQIIDALNAHPLVGGLNSGQAFGAQYPWNGKMLFLRNVRAKAFNGESATVQLAYDNDIAGQNSAYVVTYRGYLQAYETNRLPGTRVELIVPRWVKGGSAAAARNDALKAAIASGAYASSPSLPTLAPEVPPDLSTQTFEFPMRSITISGIKQGANPPIGKYDSYIGMANDATWQGLDAGYWKITDGGATVSKYGGYFNFNLTATTKNIEDWSTITVLYQTHLRIYVQTDPDDELTCRNAPYQYGIIFNTDGSGILRVGPYKTTSFDPLFGLNVGTGLFGSGFLPDLT